MPIRIGFYPALARIWGVPEGPGLGPANYSYKNTRFLLPVGWQYFDKEKKVKTKRKDLGFIAFTTISSGMENLVKFFLLSQKHHASSGLLPSNVCEAAQPRRRTLVSNRWGA